MLHFHAVTVANVPAFVLGLPLILLFGVRGQITSYHYWPLHRPISVVFQLSYHAL